MFSVATLLGILGAVFGVWAVLSAVSGPEDDYEPAPMGLSIWFWRYACGALVLTSIDLATRWAPHAL